MLNGFACNAIEQQRETAARDVLRIFAHVPIDEDGWLVSDDKLLKKDEVKVDETQSQPARGVVIGVCLVLARKPSFTLTLTLTAACVLDTHVAGYHE